MAVIFCNVIALTTGYPSVFLSTDQFYNYISSPSYKSSILLHRHCTLFVGAFIQMATTIGLATTTWLRVKYNAKIPATKLELK